MIETAPETVAATAPAERPPRSRAPRYLASVQEAGVGYVATSAVLMGAGYRLWQDCHPTDNPAVMALDLSCYALGFAILLNLRRQLLGSYCVLIGCLAALLAESYGLLTNVVTSYQSDSILFNHYSAILFLQGRNPYAATMAPAYGLFNVPQSIVTPMIDGSAIHALSYPALSFLVYVPFMLCSLTNMLWVSVLAHALVVASLFFMAPRRLRFLAPLAMNVDPTYLSYTLGGVTDVLWVFPMVLAAYYWDKQKLASAAFLGLAISLKQNAWLVLPFALVHWAYDARDARRPANFFAPAGVALGIFALTNAPFALAAPRAWLHGVLAPVALSPIPFGSGIVQTLATSNLSAAVLGPVWLSVLALAVVLYARFKRALDILPFVAPALALFFASRSLENYFMYWPIVALAFVLSAKPVHAAARERKAAAAVPVRAAALAFGGVVAFALLAFAVQLARANPMSLAIVDSAFDGETKAIEAFRISAANASDKPVSVRFGVFADNRFDFWNHGFPITLRPHSQTPLTIRAGDVDRELRLLAGAGVQVVAVETGTGRETYSEPKHFYMRLQPSTVFDNASLTRWTGSPAAPRDWNYDARQLRAGVVERALVAGRRALRFNLAPSHVGGWHLASINQIVPAAFGKVLVRLYPTHDFEGGVYPRGFFGVEIVDALDHHYITAIDSKAIAPRTLHRADGTVFTVIPGRLNAWNDVPIDLDALAAGSNLAIGPDSFVNFNLTSAVYGPNRRATHDAFGGVFSGR